MTVSNISNINNKTSIKKSASKAKISHDFSIMLDEDAQTKATNDISHTETIDNLFLLQTVNSYVSQKKMIEIGYNLLDSLNQIKLDLLKGVVDAEKLAALNDSLTSYGGESSNAELNQLLEEIKTRVLVEMAKLEK